MGRKKLAPIRKKQILDAFAVCIQRYGLAKASLQRIADIAEIQQPLLRHYYPKKDLLYSAMIERIIDEVDVFFKNALRNHKGEKRISRLLDFFFGGKFTSYSLEDTAFTEFLVESYRNDSLRNKILEAFKNFERDIDQYLSEAIPGSDASRRRAVAYSLMCMASGEGWILGTGFDITRSNDTRKCAEAMIALLY